MVSRDPLNVCIAVYMMTSKPRGTMYIGVTSRFPARIYEHRNGLVAGFTKKYGVHRLVWYEIHESILSATQREKSLKRYPREWKINLIERDNPQWEDLYPSLVRPRPLTGPLAEIAKLPEQWRSRAATVTMDGRDKPGHDVFIW